MTRLVPNFVKEFIKGTFLAKYYIKFKSIYNSPSAQNDERDVIDFLINKYDISNTFVEFGFSGWEFNCANLVGSWDGMLLDGDTYNVLIGNTILPKNITVRKVWLTLENLSIIEGYCLNKNLGILSIDVDGNDFWFLKRLIKLKPQMLILEYNSTFGLRNITVPYDPNFDRTKKHFSNAYYGASLSSLEMLTRLNGYTLVHVGDSGINAFFIRNNSFNEKRFPDGSYAHEFWHDISDLEYVKVTDCVCSNN